MYLVPFLKHSASNNDVTLQSGHWIWSLNMAPFEHTTYYWFAIIRV